MDDRSLENILGQLLRAGVLLAAAVVFAGGSLYLAHSHAAVTNYHQFAMERDSLRSIQGIVALAAHFNSQGVIQLGLLLLIATPVARVIMAGIGFYIEKDWLYTVVCVIVLGVLLFSLMHAT